MANIEVVGRKEKAATVKVEDVENLKQSLRGDLLRTGNDQYDQAREIWNAMIDKKPALIARCLGVSDVIKAVNFAKNNDILVAVRGGGHNIAGNAICDGGIVIDLSQMKSVRVNPTAKLALVEPGATLGDFDQETQIFGLSTPMGINSTTGVSGLTLGGGFGWLTRKYGMTVDNLISVNVVTAEGNYIKANKSENADLFWALRGGGGNFGIVTNFEFKLHTIGPEVLSGLIVFPYEEAQSVLTQYRDFVDNMPDDLNIWAVLRKAPPLPFLPEDVHGKEMVALAICYAGNPEEGKAAIEPLRKFGNAYGEHIGVQPYTAWQTAFDPLLTPGARNYWKSHNFAKLTDRTLETVIKYAGILPSDQTEIFIGLLGGKASQVAPDAMAYSQRDANFVMNVHGRWENPSDDGMCIKWAREFFEASAEDATGGVYINFMTAEETDRIHAAYGKNYDRLVEVKKKYDPTNMFRLNQNIKPDG